MKLYADVILPLPLYDSFSYEIPESMQKQLSVGCRVLVPFGKSGCHTGIVEAIHTNIPSGVETKEIIMPLDEAPILRHPQLKLWQWMSQYYLCAPGEVMKAALPSALKVESENWLSPTPDPDLEALTALDERQAAILAFLQHAKKARIADIEKKLEIPATRVSINKLLEAGLIQIAERVVDKYVSQRESVVTLNCTRSDKQSLQQWLSSLSRSRSQEKMLIAYLDLSSWMQTKLPLKKVLKKTLLNKCGASASTLNVMIKKGIFNVEQVRINRFSYTGPSTTSSLPTLTEPQSLALRGIRHNMAEHLVTLLRGVTGSGKTEIYTHLIHDSLAQGSHVLMLVPEISLTTQLTSRLQQFFGNNMLVYHSKFSDSERVDIWNKLKDSTTPTLVLGVRSSIFLPFPRLGLIVIDEEHESSYKQYDPAPRYNARDAAIMLASMHGAKVLLGSATPAIDTYYKASSGKYGLVELLSRYADVKLPNVSVVDMCERRNKKMVTGTFSSDLLAATRNAVNEQKQVILFQNRRGYAPVVICNQCGWTPHCPHCDIALVLHRRDNTLKCHYCGYTVTPSPLCPACGSNAMTYVGYGTERLADSLHDLLPEAKISRMDLDTTRAKDAHQRIIESFSNGESNILVGTQMVSKGLDFRNVALVGIVNADPLIHFPDFRSNERAYCTYEQVAGRAGRHNDTGHVIIQTTCPSHPAITNVVTHDYKAFYEYELEQRREFAYPPFSKIININLRHKEEQTLISLTDTYAATLRRYFGHRVLGPDAPSVARIASMHIRTIMLKIEPEASMSKVKQLLRQIYASVATLPGMKSLRLYYDVDPA